MGDAVKYYVVFVGRRTGIMKSWAECAAATQGYSGAQYKSYRTLQEARLAFAAFRRSSPAHAGRPLLPSICVDAACNAVTGEMEYRGVDTDNKKELFRQGPFAHATNNIGEFLAIVHALAYCEKKGLSWPIYSDSQTAIAWVARKKARTTLRADAENNTVFSLLERAERWLARHHYTNPVLRWKTELWGENPADFGRKKSHRRIKR